MPKIIRFDRLGGPEVLKIQEEPTKQPSNGEVRIRVQAVGLNRPIRLRQRFPNLEQESL